MYANGYFSHTSQDGRTLSDRIEKHSSKYSRMGENADIGVGYSSGYWVQNFGG